MLKTIKECAGWLDWKIVVGVIVAVVGLALCSKLPSLGLLAGLAPLALVAACLVPCLVPIALIRGARRREANKHPAREDA